MITQDDIQCTGVIGNEIAGEAAVVDFYFYITVVKDIEQSTITSVHIRVICYPYFCRCIPWFSGNTINFDS